jgi:hypothetical protein
MSFDANFNINIGGDAGYGAGESEQGEYVEQAEVQMNAEGEAGYYVEQPEVHAHNNMHAQSGHYVEQAPQVNVYVEQYEKNHQEQVVYAQPTAIVEVHHQNQVVIGNNRQNDIDEIRAMDVCGVRIPVVSPDTACCILVLNCLFPGTGTMFLGCVNPGESNCMCWFLIGLCMNLLGYICIGWVWAVLFSCKVMALSALYEIDRAERENQGQYKEQGQYQEQGGVNVHVELATPGVRM